MTIITIFVGVLMIISGIYAVEAKKILDSFIALSLLSLLSVFLFVIMKAPDVAITEASVGAGLTTAVLILALRRIGGEKK
ncbi:MULTISPECIES: hydrogenase subunit MbhD domain-containing protein [unclassified Thermosipho (in: thermotogales)]|uniref:Na(+)/H(+) antiporter subunit B n=1 Tax=unclassified Thermosipho (in: thermotogales) TaxID=2676525 RepID=UPI0009860CC7|nr:MULTISPECIES: hydrogenase subunit MbhD domain-containing protein [unclassified Thermosipho (in: thermotogales)]MBT1247621.1 sodium:proton antiporter [Thermosipho sp. 1244]OOC46144.1 sodium:proton antiporter [Thermosipho sp. 1223]